MSPKRRRSTRSYVLEFGLAIVLIAAIWIWMTNGGPQAFGEWIGPQFAPR